MANTTKITHTSLQIKGLDADWSTPGDLAGFAASGLRVKQIKFNPSGASDVLIIKAGKGSQANTAAAIATTATAPELMHVKCTNDKDQRIVYFGDRGQTMWPFIDISDCTFASAALARVEMELG